MNYQQQINDILHNAYDKGIDFGTSGHSGNPTWETVQQVQQMVERLAQQQNITL